MEYRPGACRRNRLLGRRTPRRLGLDARRNQAGVRHSFYPVITAEKGKTNEPSFNALLGDKRNAETDTWYSLQNRVSSETPPTLLLLSDDDKVVPPVSSIRYYNALKENGVKASMHIYPTGGHGWGILDGFKYREQWQQAVLDWLEEINRK